MPAYELSASGCDLVVLEARDRVGGRVLSRSDLIPGKTVEAGGELLGSNHPTVKSYADKFKLKLLDVPEYDELPPERVILNGKLIPVSELKDAERDVEDLTALITDEARNVVAEQPWKTPEADRLDWIASSDRIGMTRFSPLAKLIVGTKFANDNTVPLARQSYLGNLAQIRGGGLERYWTDTEAYRCEGGNQQFATKLAEAIGSARIRLNRPVSQIVLEEKRAVVVDAQGQKYEADHVVLSAPPSTWNKIRIEPAIPKQWTPQMGHAVKNLAVVSNRFWLSMNRRPTGIGDGDIGYTWCGTEGQDTNLPEEALIAFTSGPAAQSLSSASSDEERTRRYRAAFEQLQPGYEAAARREAFIDWIHDPWTQAGYSFPAPGQVTNVGPFLESGHGRLLFTGEHTCYQFIGYMEGGLYSGVKTAKQLLKD